MKKLLSTVALLVLTSLLLCGCFGGGQPETPGNDPDSKNISVIYSRGVNYSDEVITLCEALQSFDGYTASFNLDTDSASSNEISVGKTNRPISDTAYGRLSRVEKQSESEVSYLVYSDGSSVAIAFEEDKYGENAALHVAIEGFISDYVEGKSAPSYKSGVLFDGSVDPVEYRLELDYRQQLADLDSAVAKIEDRELRNNLCLALKEFYGLMSGGTITWLANLYDPAIGGFYYSNSARDTEGFLPDIESTGQALTYLNCCGIFNSVTDGDAVPDEFKEAIGRFVKPLQDPNGYFYHPQWGKKLTDTMVERRARDLSWALSCLSFAGLKPTYDTPTGAKGDGLLWDGTPVGSGGAVQSSYSHLPMGFGSYSTAVMVSVAISVSDAYVSPALVDEQSFRAYLESGDVRNHGYGFGSELSSQLSEIIHRDSQLAEQGAGYSLLEILIDYLNENQNPDNGVWYWVDKTDSDYSYYAGVNGLLKISGIYTAAGEEFPNAPAAARTAIEAIYSDEDLGGIVDIYNTWFAIENLIKNLRSCAADKETGERNVAELRSALLADAPAAIRATMHKLSLFKKTDGSFSYLQNSSAPWSSGMSVAVKGTDEGDINATIIGGLDTADRMFSVLGISVPEFFGRGSYYQFIDVIENISPVIKDPMPEARPIDFELDNPGEAPSELGFESNSGGKSEVISDPRGEGNVFKLETLSGGNETVTIPALSSAIGESCFVLDMDMCVLSGINGYSVQISFGEAYMLCLRLDDAGVSFFDSSSNSVNKIDVDFCYTVPYGEWFNLRVEYYSGEHDTVRIKVFVDDKIIAVSDNYFDYYGKKITNGEGIPSNAIGSVKIFSMRSSQFVMLMDNILTDKTKDPYTPYHEAEDQPTVNVDCPDSDEKIYDFEGLGENTYPTDFTVSLGQGNVSLADRADNKKLMLKGTTGGFDLSVPLNRRVAGAACSIFEAELCFESAVAGELLDIAFVENGYAAQRITGYKLAAVNNNGKTTVALYEAPTGTKGAELGGSSVEIGEKFTLRIEYYSIEKATIIYINDEMVALSSAVIGGAEKFTTGRLKLSASGSKAFSLLMDDLICEKADKSFEKATEPVVDRITYDFETGVNGALLSGSAALGYDGANRILKIGASSGAVKIPVNRRSEVFSAYIFSAKIFIPNNTASVQKDRISFEDADGNPILILDIEVSDGKAELYEVTSYCTYATPLLTMDVGKYHTLVIEYFPEKESTLISVDGTQVAKTNILCNSEAYSREISFATVSHHRGMAISLDDLVLECRNKLFLDKNLTLDNPEDDDQTLTFEHSSGGNLPSRVSVSLKSGGAFVKVKELIDGTLVNKALVLETHSGAGDTVKLTASGGAFDAECMALDMRVNVDMRGSVFMFFRTSSGEQVHRININIDSAADGNGIRVDDNPDRGEANGYGTIGNLLTGKTLGEWFDLRIELYNPDRDSIEARIFVDGKHVATSTEDVWAGMIAMDISYVEITTSGSSSGSLAIGEISLLPELLTDITN